MLGAKSSIHAEAESRAIAHISFGLVTTSRSRALVALFSSMTASSSAKIIGAVGHDESRRPPLPRVGGRRIRQRLTARAVYRSFASLDDPDDHGWLFQPKLPMGSTRS